MLTLFTGENDFEVTRAIKHLVAAFDGRAERFDGADLQVSQLGDLFMGVTLFAATRLVIIKNLSENKSIWTLLEVWLPRISSDVHVVLVEPKPDKRTKTFKALQKNADVRDFPAWTERDSQKVESWVVEEARELGFSLHKNNARILVRRVGADQWLLHQALQKLAVADTLTAEVIEELIEANPAENVFNLFETALRGNDKIVRQMLEVLELSEDPYHLFGLLNGQVFQLAALSVADQPAADVARDIGAHPFAVGKMASHAERLGRVRVRKIVAAFVEADSSMKTSGGEPWLLIERALLKTARA